MPAWLTLGAPVSTLIYNLVPVAGVILWGWDAFALIFLYWIENVFIGVRTFLALALRGLLADERAALFFAAFFCIHYGIFCFGHGFFVVVTFGGLEGQIEDPNLWEIALKQMSSSFNFTVGVAAAAVWQFATLILMVVRGDIVRRTGQSLMAAPYPRIVVLHVTIILSGFALLALGAPQVGVILLALFKTVADVGLASWGQQRDDEARA